METNDREMDGGLLSPEGREVYGHEHLVMTCPQCKSIDSFISVTLPRNRKKHILLVALSVVSLVLGIVCGLPLPYFFESYSLVFISLAAILIFIVTPILFFAGDRTITSTMQCKECGLKDRQDG